MLFRCTVKNSSLDRFVTAMLSTRSLKGYLRSRQTSYWPIAHDKGIKSNIDQVPLLTQNIENFFKAKKTSKE